MAQRKFIPISLGKGKFSSGDPSVISDGYCLICRNMVVRPNRLEARAPFVYDSLMNVRGLANYQDDTNKVSRLMSVNSSAALFEKATSGDTWSSSLGTLSGTRLTDACNYRGVMYGMMDNGSGVPTAAFSFDGTTVNTSPFTSAIQGRTSTSFLDRHFIAYPRVTVTPLNTIANCYWPGATGTNVTVRTLVSGSQTITRVYPTSTGVAVVVTQPGAVTVGASSTDIIHMIRQDFRNTDNATTIPVQLNTALTPASPLDDLTTARSQAVTVGQLGATPGSTGGYLWRCTTPGTTAVGSPVFTGTALGGTVADGTAVWTAEQLQSIISDAPSINSATTTANQFEARFFQLRVPWRTNTIVLQQSIRFVNSTVTGFSSLNPVDIALKDGITDGDARKKNFGFQITTGDFYFPFVNTESATSSTKDLHSIIWSEVQKPQQFRASATYELPEVTGFATAATAVGGRYLVFKRNAFWIFNGNSDLTSLDVIPIRRERIYKGVGCLGPRALDQFEDTLYFIGEDGVYSFRIGDDQPQELSGDPMREEIMNRGSNWVESQSTYNMPLLKVNQHDREVWVYTQKGTIHVYRIDQKAWTTFDVASSAEIADFQFNPNTRKMYVAVGGFGLARVDWNSAAANDTVDNTATTYTCTKDIVTRPVELFAPRGDIVIDDIGIFHLATAAQTSQTLTAYVSTDRGATFPYSNAITLDLTDPRNRIHLYEMFQSLTVKLSHVGKAGPSIWAVSKLDVMAHVLGAEWPVDVPTQGTATL